MIAMASKNHRRLDSLLSRLFRRISQKTPKLRVTGLCKGIPSVTCLFRSQRASNAENVSIWWRHHGATSVEEAQAAWLLYLSATWGIG